jgi:hypothetical protein
MLPMTWQQEVRHRGMEQFFFGELGAAAALAGLLFVSISVNQERILELGRMAAQPPDF